MPNIPDGASYSAPWGEGVQLGLQWRANRERKREALANEALAQQQLGVTQQEQAIRNAQAAREAQDYIATQQAQAGLPARIQELMAPPAQPDQEGDIPAAERGIQPGQGLTAEQAHRQAMAEFLARTPVSMWPKVAPVQAAASREAYYEAIPEARKQVAEIAAKAREEAARIKAEYETQRVDEITRHNQEVEARDKAASDQDMVPMYHPETKKFLGYKSKTGVPHFMPQEKTGDAIAAALGGAASAASETTNDIPPVPKSPADAKVGQSYRLADGRIGKWNGKTFTIGQ